MRTKLGNLVGRRRSSVSVDSESSGGYGSTSSSRRALSYSYCGPPSRSPDQSHEGNTSAFGHPDHRQRWFFGFTKDGGSMPVLAALNRSTFVNCQYLPFFMTMIFRTSWRTDGVQLQGNNWR